MSRFKPVSTMVVLAAAAAAILVAYDSPLRGSPACNESAGPITYVTEQRGARRREGRLIAASRHIAAPWRRHVQSAAAGRGGQVPLAVA